MIGEYKKLISINNILFAWRKFSLGKTDKKDVIAFWRDLENNLIGLHFELQSSSYIHGAYEKFIVADPKKRIIHKARVRDRIVHQLTADYLGTIFEKRFIFDSYSSRLNKGTHKAVERLSLFYRRANGNRSQRCWVLKCDIKKFFDSIDHKILFSAIQRRVNDKKILAIIRAVIESFEIVKGKGLPLGNLTSQLFANIYLHEFDYFIKNTLRLKYYVRFNDDFIILHEDKAFLEFQIPAITDFLKVRLKLALPKEKIFLRKLDWGADFVGYIVLPGGVLPRTKTRKRILAAIKRRKRAYEAGEISFNQYNQILASYFGVLKHCVSFKLKQRILTSFQTC